MRTSRSGIYLLKGFERLKFEEFGEFCRLLHFETPQTVHIGGGEGNTGVDSTGNHPSHESRGLPSPERGAGLLVISDIE